jgi:hypothetical protein
MFNYCTFVQHASHALKALRVLVGRQSADHIARFGNPDQQVSPVWSFFSFSIQMKNIDDWVPILGVQDVPSAGGATGLSVCQGVVTGVQLQLLYARHVPK